MGAAVVSHTVSPQYSRWPPCPTSCPARCQLSPPRAANAQPYRLWSSRRRATRLLCAPVLPSTPACQPALWGQQQQLTPALPSAPAPPCAGGGEDPDRQGLHPRQRRLLRHDALAAAAGRAAPGARSPCAPDPASDACPGAPCPLHAHCNPSSTALQEPGLGGRHFWGAGPAGQRCHCDWFAIGTVCLAQVQVKLNEEASLLAAMR